MSILDLDAFERAPLLRDPCDFCVVPGFVRAEALEAVNRDYPEISDAGNLPLEELRFGPAFEALLDELRGPAVRGRLGARLGVDLAGLPTKVTVRRFAEPSDGAIHNDSRTKLVTALVYLNETWPHAGGRLRLLRSSRSLDDYAVEVPPERGTLVVFRRSERSFHGFEPVEAERRSVQVSWVRPKAPKPDRPEWVRRLRRALKSG